MWNVILLGLVSLFADVSGEMIYPLIPLYLASVGAGPATLGLIEGSAETVASLVKVLSGRSSDRSGRRKPLALWGYGLAAIGKLVLALAGSWPLIFVGRLTDRFGKGVRGAPRDALIADSVPAAQRGRAFGLHRAMDTLGAVFGVAVAYLVLALSPQVSAATYRLVFAIALAPALVSVALLTLARERRAPPAASAAGGPTTVRGRLRALAAGWRSLDGRLRGFLLLALLFTLGNSSNQFLLLRAGQIGDSPLTVLLLYGMYNVVSTLLAYPAGALSDRVGRRALLAGGYALYGLVYLGFALAQGPAALWPLFAVYGAYTALTEGVEKALLVDLAPPQLKGTLIGLHGAIVGAGLLPASLLAGLLWGWLGPAAPFLFGGVVGLVAAAGVWVVLGRLRHG